MSDKTASKSIVTNNAPPPQQLDLNAFAELASAVKGSIPASEKGFVPLTDFPPTKPYEDWGKFLDAEKQLLETERQRLRDAAPETKLEQENEELKTKKAILEKQHEEDIGKRFDDLAQYHRERFDDLQKFYDEKLRLHENNRNNLAARISELETVRSDLETRIISDYDRYIAAIKTSYEERIALTQKHHEALRQELKEASTTAWLHAENTIKHIQETIQAKESRLKAADFLEKKTGYPIFLALSWGNTGAVLVAIFLFEFALTLLK